ncbi:ubiquitin carboxyl-terminal hydrolase 2-like isoform X2 [Brachionus plicatilis]|uniref:Ubiquitin carboxyl-terminal hydrolase n=1 Tax=Brachionus plicatilis TaxID=10195 RepID=A0A3M7S0M5_BRAPC|nr:ubiquitin carboxyl-terminal hydrolase 2-like isoform X2 [Brachionus plicatilis]
MNSYYTLNRPGVVSRGRTQSPAPQRNYISSLPSPNYQIISQAHSKYSALTNQRGTETAKISVYDQNKLPNANLAPSRSTSVSNRYSSPSSKLITPDLNNRPLGFGKNSADTNGLKAYQEDIKFTANECTRNENNILTFNKPIRANNQYLTIKNANLSTSTASVTSSSSSSSIKNNYDAILSNINSNCSGARIDKNEKITEINLLAQRGNIGLRNLGNTCFMNSILQCLCNTKFLVEYILTSSYAPDLNKTLSTMKGSLFSSFAELIKKMWKGNDMAVNPQEFRLQLIKYSPNFSGYSQQDAEEFLTYLIKGLHEDVNLVKVKPAPFHIDEKTWDKMNDKQKSDAHWKVNFRCEQSRISDLFVGQLKSTLRCTKCEFKSTTYELFWDLAVPIPSRNPSIKLDDCIKLFMSEEILDGDNKPVCSNCKEKRRCAKRYSIEKPPKILVIHLKRFLKARFNNKINLPVEYPIDGLDISKHLSSNIDFASSQNNTRCIYDLYGISLHSGTESSGHYVAYCKNPFNKKWYYFNDQSVKEIQASSLQSPNAYILFYELRE